MALRAVVSVSGSGLARKALVVFISFFFNWLAFANYGFDDT